MVFNVFVFNVMYYIEKIKIKRIKYICIASIVCIGIWYQIFVNKPLPWYIEILFTCFIFIYLGYYMKNIIIKDKTGGGYTYYNFDKYTFVCYLSEF